MGAGAGQVIEQGDLGGAQLLLQKEQSHQRHQSADHRHRQIGHGRPGSFGGLLLDDPGKGGKGHDLKEDKGGIQIRCQEHPQSRPQGKEIEEVVPAQVVMVPEILRGQKQRHRPHQADDHDVNPPEAVHHQLQSGEQGERYGHIRPKADQKRKGQTDEPGGNGGTLSLFSGEIGGEGHDHGEENK